MTHTDYTKNILNIKDENIKFYKNRLENVNINGIDTKIFKGYLTYKPFFCPNCGVINESNDDIIKWNWKRNCKIILPKVSIKLDLMNKISEKDIAFRNNVSHNTVNRIIHELSSKTVLPQAGILPNIINIDAFKATNDTIDKRALIITNNTTRKVFDILPSRKSNYIKNYFFKFPRKQRLKVKFVIIDLFGTYYYLLKFIFPKATIISDRFHVGTLANNAFKCTRIKIMKKEKKL